MGVVIREHEPSDIEAYFEWQSHPLCARWVSWLPKSREQSEEGLLDAIQQQHSVDRVRYFFAVVDASSNEMIGDVGFTIVDHEVADCGWFLRPAFWGRGFASAAVRLLVDRAFAVPSIKKLKASCAAENVRSERVMQKAGFSFVSRTHDRVRYQFLRSDWQEHHNRSPE